MSIDLAIRLGAALFLTGGVLFAVAGTVALGMALARLHDRIKGWLVLRRVKADLLDRDRKAAGFWRHVEHRGLHEKTGPLSVGRWR